MLSCSIVLHLLSTEAAVYNYKLILTKRGGVGFFFSLCLLQVARCTLKCQPASWFMVCCASGMSAFLYMFSTGSLMPSNTHTGLATVLRLLYTADFSTSLQVPGEFQANSMMPLNSIWFEIPRDVVWSGVRLCQAGVCKWETGDRSSILPLSCGPALPRAFLPILSPAFILITTCIISCQLLTPANRKGCPQRPCFFCILFSI